MHQQNTPEAGTLATATVPADTTDTQHPARVTGNTHQTAAVLETAEDRRREALRMAGYWQKAPERIKSLCWNLAQTPETTRNLPVLLAFTLAMDLLDAEWYATTWEAEGSDPKESPVSEESIIANFWRGAWGFGHSAPQDIHQAQREAITAAAKGLFALAEAPKLQSEKLEARP